MTWLRTERGDWVSVHRVFAWQIGPRMGARADEGGRAVHVLSGSQQWATIAERATEAEAREFLDSLIVHVANSEDEGDRVIDVRDVVVRPIRWVPPETGGEPAPPQRPLRDLLQDLEQSLTPKPGPPEGSPT